MSQPFLIIDLTDEYFHISSITEQDAIHAKKDEISSIFKISLRKLTSPKQMKYLYVLTNNEFERDHYINLIYDRLTHIKTCIQNGSIVS